MYPQDTAQSCAIIILYLCNPLRSFPNNLTCSHFVSDVVLSSDGHFALSGSWDKCLRLWDLSTGKTTRRFEDHSKDVLSVAFSGELFDI